VTGLIQFYLALTPRAVTAAAKKDKPPARAKQGSHATPDEGDSWVEKGTEGDGGGTTVEAPTETSSALFRKEANKTGNFPVAFFVKRYAAFCETAGERLTHRRQLWEARNRGNCRIAAGIHVSTQVDVKRRNPQFLLKTIEEVYDAATQYYKDTRTEVVMRALGKVSSGQQPAVPFFRLPSWCPGLTNDVSPVSRRAGGSPE
jgi:hypothetical protein